MSCEKHNKENNSFSNKTKEYYNNVTKIYDDNKNSLEKLIDFPKYVPNNSIKQFVIRYELIKLIKDIPGDIIECGVCGGRGLFSLLQSHLILEPKFFYRKIIGFDTFTGFTSISKDKDNEHEENDFCFDNMNELDELGKLHTEFQFESLNKIKLVKGDACATIPNYLNENKHTIISLLYLDFDLYNPTKVALETFLPRMSKGSIIAFDEMHFEKFPGETLAMLEFFNINNYSIRNVLNSNVNYITV